jgi:hypothetical protein
MPKENVKCGVLTATNGSILRSSLETKNHFLALLYQIIKQIALIVEKLPISVTATCVLSEIAEQNINAHV